MKKYHSVIVQTLLRNTNLLTCVLRC